MNLKNKVTLLEKELQSKNDQINKYKVKYKHYKQLTQNIFMKKQEIKKNYNENDLKSSLESNFPIKKTKDFFNK